jgi:hypothetical protein
MSEPIDSPAASIDWSTITEQIECPLCLYNLRGLSQPRCPECGYQFDWAELLDPQRRRHRYLFEHHPAHNLWSFLRTLIGGLRTRKFWTDLKPTHTIWMRRLIIYWLICSSFLVLAPIVASLELAVNVARGNARQRAMMPPAMGGYYTAGTRQRWLDANFPIPPSSGYFRQVWTILPASYLVESAGLNVALILAWPWLTFASLMIFQASMKKAMVQRVHVLRCVLYSADASVWYVLLTILGMSLAIVLVTLRPGPGLYGSWPVGIWFVWALWLLRLDRLWIAYRRYLRFDHPFWVALASQIVVILGGAALFFWGGRVIRLMIYGVWRL